MIHLQEALKGGMIGLLHTTFGHPLDTLKTLEQYKKICHKNVEIKQPTLKSLYSGVRFPMYLNIFYNSGIFGIYSFLLHTNLFRDNIFLSGFVSGGIMSICLNPFEYYKVREQMMGNNRVTYKIPMIENYVKNEMMEKRERKNKIIMKLYNEGMIGLKYTFLRESLACGIYFKTYDICSKKLGLNPFISGGLAGCNSWLLTYPIDTIKTRYQLDQTKGTMDMFKRGGLWNGLSYCLLRAFLVNGISFTCYEMV